MLQVHPLQQHQAQLQTLVLHLLPLFQAQSQDPASLTAAQGSLYKSSVRDSDYFLAASAAKKYNFVIFVFFKYLDALFQKGRRESVGC